MKKIITLISFIVFASVLFAQPLVQTYVGTGTPGQISVTTPRLSAGMDMPYGVAMDSKGNLWIAEEGGNGYGFVIKMIQGANAYVRAGGVGQDCFKNGAGTASRFSQPRGVAVDGNDNIYIADYGNGVIRKIDKFLAVWNSQWVSVYAGKWDTTQGCYDAYPGFADGTVKTAQFNGPCDIAYDKTTGAFYVADANNNAIRKILNGQVTTVAGRPDSSGFRDGTLAMAKFNYPTGIFVDASGDIYVADHMNQVVRKITLSTGMVSTVVPLAAGLWTPDDVWVKTNGDIYISDQHRIRLYSASKLSTYAGSSTPNDYGDTDAIGTIARFNSLKCLIADNSNSDIFYVADQGNHKGKKVTNCVTYVPTVIRYGGQNITDTSYTCTGDTIYLTTDSTFASYKWSTGETTQTIFKTSSISNITCTVTNSNGCPGTSYDYHVRITPLKPLITPDGPTTFCPGGKVVLVGPSNYDWYKWLKNGSLFDEGGTNKTSITVNTADTGTYILTGTVGGCTGSSNPMKVSASNQIVPDVTIVKGSPNLCANDTLILQANGTYTSYSWKKDGVQISTGSTITVTTAGVYTLYATQGTGCSGTSNPITVTILPVPATPTFTVNKDTLTCSDATGSYQWYLNNQKIYGAVQKICIAKQSGSYSVEVGHNLNGCKSRSATKQVTLSIVELSDKLRFNVYPNPATGQITINGTFSSPGDFNVRIVNMLGKQVYENNMNLGSGSFEKQINLQGNSSGLYFVIISSQGKQGIMKLILK